MNCMGCSVKLVAMKSGMEQFVKYSNITRCWNINYILSDVIV